MAGDMTLISELGSVRLAIQGAVSQAFKTPEVIKLFANKQPAQLRLKLEQVRNCALAGPISLDPTTSEMYHRGEFAVLQMKESLKLKRLSEDVYLAQAVEILAALKKLGEQVSCQLSHRLLRLSRADMLQPIFV